MGRKAGDSTTYEWRLWDKSANRYVKDESIELPSVTTIVKGVLAKHLAAWDHTKTIDQLAAALEISGLARLEPDLLDVPDEDGMTAWDYLTDGEALCEWLAENQLRPSDFVQSRGDEGREHHDVLEALATHSIIFSREAAHERAATLRAADDLTRAAIGKWWAEHNPEVLAPEQTIRSLKHGYAGTLDLAYVAVDGARTIVDLKTRNYKGAVWDSDRAQLGGLAEAYEEHKKIPVDRLEVFVARDDGKVVTEVVDPKWRTIFLDLNEIYQLTHQPKF